MQTRDGLNKTQVGAKRKKRVFFGTSLFFFTLFYFSSNLVSVRPYRSVIFVLVQVSSILEKFDSSFVLFSCPATFTFKTPSLISVCSFAFQGTQFCFEMPFIHSTMNFDQFQASLTLPSSLCLPIYFSPGRPNVRRHSQVAKRAPSFSSRCHCRE